MSKVLEYLQALEPTVGSPDILSLIITTVISASVFAALVTGLVQYFINRRNSRITERKNTVDAESDLIARYKEAAAEERSQKESAVETVRNLLNIAEAQVDSLKSTIVTLNNSIDLMAKMASTQQDVIDQLTFDRDRTKSAMDRAIDQIDKQKAEIFRHQQEILELTYPEGVSDQTKKDVK